MVLGLRSLYGFINFVDLTDRYEYRVQMIHQNSTKIIQREFVSDFEVGVS
jgi:hypothetical protein